MKAGTFLGHDIGGGVRPEFQKHLDTAKTKVDDEYKKSGNPIRPDTGSRMSAGTERALTHTAPGLRSIWTSGRTRTSCTKAPGMRSTRGRVT